jgi:hypothetical protein
MAEHHRGGDVVDPDIVDVQTGRVEFNISQLGSFQVVNGGPLQ